MWPCCIPYNMAIFKKKTISFLFLFWLKFQMEKDKIGKERTGKEGSYE